MREWNPIGFGDTCPVDEYQAYADKAYVMLMDEEANAEQLAAYLVHTATEYMGLNKSEDLTRRSRTTATMLIALRPDLQTH